MLFLVWDPSTWLITPSQHWEIVHPLLVFLSKSFNFRASLVRLMENWAALSCSKEQCSHSLAWHSSISPNVHRYRLLINASELFWDWKFKGFKFCLVLLWCTDKSGLMLDSDALWHLRQPRISLHGDTRNNLSPDLCLFLMIELYNFQKWPLKSHCILQCEPSAKLQWASTASWRNHCAKKLLNIAQLWGSGSHFSYMKLR